MFYVGQKVVCVHARRKPGEPEPWATVGQVYTVAQIFASCIDGLEMLQFCEMRFDGCLGWEPGWPAKNFRPVVERKTDISSLKALLNPKTAETV